MSDLRLSNSFDSYGHLNTSYRLRALIIRITVHCSVYSLSRMASIQKSAKHLGKVELVQLKRSAKVGHNHRCSGMLQKIGKIDWICMIHYNVQGNPL